MKAPDAAPRRPNVVVILADDQGPWAMGCAGNPEIRTPNLDRLARSGIRFDRFFCASPVCSPARASLLTGLMPSRHGVMDWLARGNVDSAAWGVGNDDVAIEYLEGIPAYTDALAAHGWTAALCGKWHLGDAARPQKSISHWFVHTQSGGHYYVNAPMFRDGRIERQAKYLTEAITDDAVAFIERQTGPFCCEVHYTAPHSPWVGCHPQETVDSYADCPFETCPDLPMHPWQVSSAPSGRGPNRRPVLQGYYAAITEMDRGIGRILDALERRNLRRDTLVFFLSDNGMCMGHHGLFGKGNASFPQNMYEESVIVPAIVSRPGSVPEGRVESGLYSQVDWFPTLLDYLGLPDPGRERRPGASFAGVLRGQSLSGREEVVVCEEYGPVRMIRDREWKYVHRYAYGPHELYDLCADPGETRNLADDPGQQTRVRHCRERLDGFFARHADPEIDGARQPVTGRGQLDRVGRRAALPASFAPRHCYQAADGGERDDEHRWGLFPPPADRVY
jgi:arylsulfatase A-like enzyme